ncbi:hypothetical protein COCC4DRAFT_125725 [Bipolaris maydis ATCC 48331]|uniref:Uncharacterized protein n=2 Tax=Cochliobolus heterostrophus TaxID=5016 RepID=M2UNQ0_COCH5|nr:uncharacterized protein COCC4DRAFT_125725 [Bipolaris maydis ATCC 48331]EMD89552.1 hypothetical protein COCHEDRAFT_1177199 [Bipolaris maydis C5]KAJ5025722.1 hypothetical protein J3E73DRAFT_424564 [Bipolaris maydis]ENI10235.1 hypothetical protein COCC4DRAFT_125725 [Bipolaris maydis ATCC 48331]KAJ5064336.1 hypothetical protein J3E74DRAFT_311622 [Bipolaris maydis]KAJ6196518.1 hypothetical protein J3E72DRAFT_243666 [Bipolaris maydis]
MTVEKGNKIFIAEGDIAANPATVNWQQNLSQKSDTYYMAVFTNKDKNNEQSYIFIQQGKLDALKAKSSGDAFTITVDDSFQYGQKNKQGEGRFLVFHDKSRNPFQWRFVSTLYSKLGNGALAIINLAPIPDGVKDIAKYFSGLIGDPLHNF